MQICKKVNKYNILVYTGDMNLLAWIHEDKVQAFLAFLKRSMPYIICFLFFVAYATLSIVRHNHYQSFGYDLGINDQLVWKYSTLQWPITTIDPFPTGGGSGSQVQSELWVVVGIWGAVNARRSYFVDNVRVMIEGV